MSLIEDPVCISDEEDLEGLQEAIEESLKQELCASMLFLNTAVCNSVTEDRVSQRPLEILLLKVKVRTFCVL